MQCFQCVECSTYYAAQKVSQKGVVIEKVPDSLVCQQNEDCQTVGLCTEIELSIDEVIDIVVGGTRCDVCGNRVCVCGRQDRELGLCLFLMDASGSMGEHAFGTQIRDSILKPDPHPNDHPGVEDTGKMSKREMVALAAERAIKGLEYMSNKTDAYIGIILYDHRQEPVFFKSVEKIFEETRAKPNAFAKELLKRMKDLNGGTDINGALKMAVNLVKKFKSNQIEALGSFNPMKQNIPHYYDVDSGIKLPTGQPALTDENIRIVLYTDGEQLAEYGALEIPPYDTPTNKDATKRDKSVYKPYPDPLICAYIGEPLLPNNKEARGARELRSVVRHCPVHGHPQMIVVNKVESFKTLHGIFRMASGASGFCEQCLKVAFPTSDVKKKTTDS